jgi:hypothetical protein
MCVPGNSANAEDDSRVLDSSIGVKQKRTYSSDARPG